MTTLTDIRHVVRTWFEYGENIGAKYLCVVESNGSVEPEYITYEHEFGTIIDEMHRNNVVVREVYDLKQNEFSKEEQLLANTPWFTGHQTTNSNTDNKEDEHMSQHSMQDTIQNFINKLPSNIPNLSHLQDVVANFIDLGDVCEIVNVHLVYHPDISDGYHMFLDDDIANQYISLLNNTETLTDQIPHKITRKGVLTDGDVWLLDQEVQPKSLQEIASVSDFASSSHSIEAKRKEALSKLSDEDLEVLGLTR